MLRFGDGRKSDRGHVADEREQEQQSGYQAMHTFCANPNPRGGSSIEQILE